MAVTEVTEEEYLANPHLYTKIPHDLFDEQLSYGALGVVAVLLVDDGKRWKNIDEFKGPGPNKSKGRSDKMARYIKEISSSKYSHLLDKIGDRGSSKIVSLKAREMLSQKGDKQCEWCSRCCHFLIEHHYPIPHRFGGHETVNICGTCHEDFHYLERHLSANP